MKPKDAEGVASAAVVIIHPYQKYLVEKIVKINKKAAIEVLDAKDLNAPAEYIDGLARTGAILEKYMPGQQAGIRERLGRMQKSMTELMAKDMLYVKKTAAKHIKILCSYYQADTATYAGFEIAGIFGGPDAMTPEKLKAIAVTAKKQGVKYIFSNLTGDHDTTADIINKQVKTVKIVLSSFPAEEGDGSWYLNLYDYNMGRIRSALGEK